MSGVEWAFASEHLPSRSDSRRGPAFDLAEAGKLAPFKVKGELGRGGMGTVLQVSYRGRPYALKLLMNDSQRVRMRMAREAQILGALDHPGIVSLRGAGQVSGHAFLLHDLVPGARSLSAAWSGMDLDQRVGLISQTAEAVAYAHECGVLHRDLKPDNILVDEDAKVRVIDFGLATTEEDAGRLTRSGAWLGTVEYMAPEQFSASRAQQVPAVDVWSLGVLLYEALTERVPFRGQSALDLAGKVQLQQPTPPRRLNPEVPLALERVCLRALSKDPKARQPNAGQFVRELQQARYVVPSRAFPAWGWGLIVAVLLCSVLGGVVVTSSGPSEPGLQPPALGEQGSPVQQEAFADIHEALERLGGRELCARARERLLEDPNDLSAELALAVGCFDLDEFEIAAAAAQRVLDARPDDVIAWEALAGAAYHLQRTDEAERACYRTLELDPTRAAPWVLRSLMLYERGDGARSLEAARKAVALAPNNPMALAARGLGYLELHQPQRAIDDFDAAIELDFNGHTVLNRAIAYTELGRMDKAIVDLDRLRSIPAYRWTASYGYVQCLLRLGDSRAVEASEELEAEFPTRQEASSMLGFVYRREGRLQEAAAAYRRSRDLNPTSELGVEAAEALRELEQ